MMKWSLLFFILLVLIPVALTEIKVPCPTVEITPKNLLEIRNLSSSLSVIHCKGAEYNVSLVLINKYPGNISGFVEVDGWDPDTGLHVTNGLIKVELRPGESKVYSIMLPIDTQTAKNYYFNATFLPSTTSALAFQCSAGGVPLYKYIIYLVGKG